MALNRPLGNMEGDYNSLYKITLDVSGWDKTTIQVVAPVGGTLFVYGSLDGGAGDYHVTQGNATLATNFQPIQATNLATGTATSTITGAGTYSVTDNNQFLRLQGSPAAAGTNIYKLFITHIKGS